MVDALLRAAIDIAPSNDVPWLVLDALTTTAIGPVRGRPPLLEATQGTCWAPPHAQLWGFQTQPWGGVPIGEGH